MSGAGVLSRTHYDKGHNLFAQLRGRKEVLLWPPEQLPKLHIYPAIHAAHRQSQVHRSETAQHGLREPIRYTCNL